MRPGTYRSFAKINLHLQVIGRRGDGYHELRTVFQSIDLHDRVECAPGSGGLSLEVEGGGAPEGADNLAYRAAELFFERWGPPRAVRIRLHKRVPMGGGLGGGSSNAATVLRALRDLTGDPESVAELWPLARELGADVPFFLVEGTALGVGRGDEVVALPELPESELWVATPPQAVSTAEVFGRLEEPAWQPLAASVLELAAAAPPGGAAGFAGRNDLEPLVLRWYPAVAEVYNALLDAGARVVRLSGTGAALFAFFDQPQADLTARLPAGTRAFPTRTLSRQAIARRRLVR